MDRAGIKPDVKSYGPLIVALAKKKEMSQAEGLLRELEFSGLKPDEFIWNWLVEGYARTDALPKAFELAKQMQEQGTIVSRKLKHVLLTQCRKHNKLEFYESQFGPVEVKKEPWQLSYEEEFESIVPMTKVNPKGKAEKWPLLNRRQEDEPGEPSPIAVSDPRYGTTSIPNEVISELEVGEKFKPSEWVLVDDPFSTPKSSTLEKRKAKKVAASKIKLVIDQVEEQASSLTKDEKKHAKDLDRKSYQAQRRKEGIKSEALQRARNRKRKEMAKYSPEKKRARQLKDDEDFGKPPARASLKFR